MLLENAVDIVMIAALVIAVLVGIARGLVASLGVHVGAIVGAFIAVWLVPLLAPYLAGVIPDLMWRGVLTATLVVLIVIAGARIGGIVGRALRRRVDRAHLRLLDRTLGAVAGALGTALVLLLVGPAIAANGTPVVSGAISGSRVLGAIDRLTPAPVDAALARLRTVVVDEGMPRFGELLDFTATDAAPPVSLDDPVLQQAAGSVARISGTAYACAIAMTGSGVIVGEGLIATNAHVVAGVVNPLVELPGRAPREGRVVAFDPERDVAIIAADDLGAPALTLSDGLAPGDAAAVQGYPHGGPFTSVGATVLSEGLASIPDIYDAGSAPREIYALAADVQPGNSGGPLLTPAGEVAGIVFARGEDGAGRGYAMTLAEVQPLLQSVTAASAPVSTGSCVR